MKKLSSKKWLRKTITTSFVGMVFIVSRTFSQTADASAVDTTQPAGTVTSAVDSVSNTSPVIPALPLADKLPSAVTIKIFSHVYYDFTEKQTNTSGFDLTRAYFGYNHSFSPDLSTKLLLDVGRMNEITAVTVKSTLDTIKGPLPKLPAITNTVAPTTENRYEAFLKIAMLEWKGLVPMTTLEMGMIGLRQYSFQDKMWGYRYVSRTFLDKNGFAQPADLGIAAVVSATNNIKAHVTFTNGEGFTKPQDKNGDLKSAVGLELSNLYGFSASLYADYMPVVSSEKTLLASYLGFEIKDFIRLSGEYNYLVSEKKGKDQSGISLYGTYIITKQFELFGRLDVLLSKDDWNKVAGGDGNTLIGGIQYAPVKGVKVAANYQVFADEVKSDIVNKAMLNLELSL